MAKILSVKPVQTKLGKQVILVTTFDGTNVKDHWCSFGQWKAKNLSLTSFDAYVGGQFEADYYQEGEVLLSGDPVTQSDTILRDFVASMNPAVSAAVVALESRAKADSMAEANAMFKARRTAQLAAAAKLAADAAIAAAAAAPAVTPVTPVASPLEA